MKLPKVTKHSLTMKEYTVNLRTKGHRLLGHGYFAQVFAKAKSTSVVKVGHVVNDNIKRDPYLTFIKNIDQSNPFFPRIKSVKIFKGPSHKRNRTDMYYVVRMERLVNFYDVDNPADELSKLGVRNISQLEGHVKRGKFKSKLLGKAHALIRKLCNHYASDVHAGNVMWRREDGQVHLIITDPIAHHVYDAF